MGRRPITDTLLISVILMTSFMTSQSVKIGILAHTGTASWQYFFKIASAINIAEDRLITEGVIENGTIESYIWKEALDEADGVGRVVGLSTHDDVDLIIGAAASRVSIPAAHLTSFLNLPHVTWSGNSYDLADKTLFSTFVRTVGPLSESGMMLVTLFKRFGWERIGMLYRDHAVCQYSANGLKDYFPAYNLTIMQSIAYPQTTLLTAEVIDRYLLLIKGSCRIIFICVTSSLRSFLIRACKLGMCNGDYLFVYTYIYPPDPYKWKQGDADDDIVKQAYKYLLQVATAQWKGDEGKARLEQFELEVMQRMSDPPWNNTYGQENDMAAGPGAQHLYNAMYLYGLWLNHSATHGLDHKDGAAWSKWTKHVSFEGVSGPCDIGPNSDRLPYFWIYQFVGDDLHAEIVAISENKNTKITDLYGFHWNTVDGEPPADMPECGFLGELCTLEPPESENNIEVIVTTMCLLTLLAAVVILGFIYRRRKIENELLQSVWKITVDDIEPQKPRGMKSKINMMSQSVLSVGSSVGSLDKDMRVLTQTAMLKGQVVAMRCVNKRGFLTQSELQDLKTMREMIHDNINQFIGACFDATSPFVLFQYCPKGSLQDILENDEIQLDANFKNSLTMDLVMGMQYIHNSKLLSHGRLKSSNCLVDNRWMLKVTDYGISRFLGTGEATDMEEHQKYKSMLWTAPELLSNVTEFPKGTKEGDVYSFGIILHEIFYRMGTFSGNGHLSTKDIVNRVKNRENTPCRPAIYTDSKEAVVPDMVKLMQQCWSDTEINRPRFSVIRTYIKKNIQHGLSVNIVDVILQRLEKYASNLEELVDQRTQQLLLEKQKSDKLLYRMLPKSCADKLKTGEHVVPEVFESATVFFSDIVGFTTIATLSTPIEVVDFLNDLYTCFDSIIAKYDAYKVETIGDAYLVVSGLPNRNGDKHAGIIADMSLDIVKEICEFKIRHLTDHSLKVRIGNHTGSCCAGIVGLSMPRFCVFGDTVNTASRMESNGAAQKIHMSESTRDALQKLGGYTTTFRAELDIKGKGLMRTYWLETKDKLNNLTDSSLASVV